MRAFFFLPDTAVRQRLLSLMLNTSENTKENAIPGSNRVQDMVAYLEARTTSLESAGGKTDRIVAQHGAGCWAMDHRQYKDRARAVQHQRHGSPAG